MSESNVKINSTLIKSEEVFIAYQSSTIPNTGGGAFTPGVWTTRAINDVQATASYANLSAGQVNLFGGYCYEINAFAEFYLSDFGILRIFDVNNGLTLIQGTMSWSNSSSDDQSTSTLCGEICLTQNTTIELQHLLGSANAFGFGGGRASPSGVTLGAGLTKDVFATIKISKKRAF